jgi:predicted ATP-dependent serine protease
MPLQIKYTNNEDEKIKSTITILDEAESFIMGSDRVLLILGSPGCGKSISLLQI